MLDNDRGEIGLCYSIDRTESFRMCGRNIKRQCESSLVKLSNGPLRVSVPGPGT